MSLSPMTVFVLQCHSVPTSSSSFASHPDSDTAYTHPHLNSFAILTAWRLASFLSLQRQQQLRKPHWRLSRPLLQWNLGRVENSVAKSQEHSIQQERVNNDICGSGPPSKSIFSGHVRVTDDWQIDFGPVRAHVVGASPYYHTRHEYRSFLSFRFLCSTSWIRWGWLPKCRDMAHIMVYCTVY